ncbi:hypothetical protein I4U23_006063 [Adineta vaga]|nr:hypothetical protein I4U23_006063 [Adineta vaga]
MSVRKSSFEYHENRQTSSLTKLILLSQRTIRYTIRVRICRCIPVILCELIFPLVILGIIIYCSHDLLNTKETNEILSSSSNETETCFEDLQKKFQFYNFENDCLQIEHKIYQKQFSKVNLILRFLNQTNENKDLLNILIQRINNHLQFCKLKGKTNFLLWNHLNKNSILFDEENGFNFIIDIHQLTSIIFSYDIIVQMPKEKTFLEKIIHKIDFSFLQKHQHPTEQFDLFSKSNPPFSNIKIFLDSIVISILLNEKKSLIPSWTFSRITCTSYRHHRTIPTRWSFILIEYSLSITYLFYSFIIIHFILQEKNMKIKEIIKIIHIQPLINYLAWTLRPLFILSIITILITITWKLSINGWIIFKYVSAPILLFILTILNIQMISFSILMGQLFNSMSRLFFFIIILWIVMNILAFQNLDLTIQFILCLNPYYSLLCVLRNVFLFERAKKNVTFFQELYSCTPSIGNLIFYITLSILFSWIFIWYWEKVYPGEYGIGLPWTFPFSMKYWTFNNDEFIIVKIRSLCKYFPEANRIAVNNVDFNLNKNQITALLGHNGAGKTTIMNMLCGMYEQTSGSIQIFDYDTREEMDYLRQFISYCPQLQEQIEFYAIARGYSQDKEDICSDLLEAVSLSEDRNVLCKNLSGGMKRRLSIACAFIGNTKFVLLGKSLFGNIAMYHLYIVCLLDEPSSGLDPVNRRLLWSWIRSMKENEVYLRIAIDENNIEDEEDNEELIENNCFDVFNNKLIYNDYEYYLSQYEGLFIKSFRIAYRSYLIFLFICSLSYSMKFLIENKDYSREIIFNFDDWSHLKHQNVFIAFVENDYDQKTLDHMKSFIHQYSPLTRLFTLRNLTTLADLNQLLFTHRQWSENAYTQEYFGILFETSEIISILTSHLIIGYEPFSLISQYSCHGQCSILTRLKFIKNPSNKFNDKTFLDFLKSFSVFSCFYLIYPGEYTLFYLVTYYFIYIYITILLINEDQQFIKLMKIFGLHPIIYWTGRYIFDLLLTLVYSWIIYFIFSMNNQKESNENESSLSLKQIMNENNNEIKNRFFSLTFLIASTTLPTIYLITKFIKNDLIGGILIYFLLILIEIFDLIRILILLIVKNTNRYKMIYWIMNIVLPPLNSKRLIAILLKSSTRRLCQILENDQTLLSKIGIIQQENKDDFFKHLFISFIQMFLLFFILCLIDIGFLTMKAKNFEFDDDDDDDDEIDDDVLNERTNLLSNRDDYLNEPLLCLDIVKKYPQKFNLAIDHLTFHVQRGQCFGLLGFNGAGKTSLFKIIVGDEKVTNGSIYINGKCYEKFTDGICRDIGYCPQYDCIVDKLTLEDYLYLFARLRGIHHSKLEETIQAISQLFLLDFYRKQYLKQCSGGTIRRMHAALACIGSPSIILLDEPTTGVDPYSRRQMRRIFEYALNCDLTIILTSHSMEECEILCSRLGIMSAGQFKCLGNIQNLKQKFGNIYTISIKFQSNFHSDQFKELTIYLKTSIRTQIYNQTDTTIIYRVEHSSPAKLFHLIEEIKDKYFIETYSIQQMTLEQIFIYLQNH